MSRNVYGHSSGNFDIGRYDQATRNILAGTRTQGIDYYVGPTATGNHRGSDGNDGRTPFRPLATISKAYAKCASGLGDRILLLPGSYSMAAALTISKSDIAILGAKNPYSAIASGVVITCPATAPTTLLHVEASNVELGGLTLGGGDGVTTTLFVGDTADISGFWMHDCIINDSATAATNVGVQLGDVTATATGADNAVIENCVFAGEAASITIEGGNLGVIRGNHFFVTANAKTCISVSDAGTALADVMNISDNYFHGYDGDEVAVTLAGAEGEQVGCGIANNILFGFHATGITLDIHNEKVAYNHGYSIAGGALIDPTT